MSEKSKKRDKSKVDKPSKKARKDEKAAKEKQQQKAFTLLADEKAVNSSLSSLFAIKQPPVKAQPAPAPTQTSEPIESDSEDDNDAELSELDESIGDADEDNVSAEVDTAQTDDPSEIEAGLEVLAEEKPKRKRKRKDAEEELEDAYMNRLAREEEKDRERLATERATKRQKQKPDSQDAEDSPNKGGNADDEEDDTASVEVEDEDEDGDSDAGATSPPPKHETQEQADEDLAKANRTVFLGNVSTDAISSKSSRKTLLNHLGSFFSDLPASKDGFDKPKVESLRFRSTPYASAIPKKAAFAKKELMDATSKSTNAYAVYSSQQLAREATRRLNGTTVLSRHLRVDQVAHPAKVDNRRCVFVGNLGFVDDESNIQDANEEDGREKRKRGKEPADIEEGLWRTFGKCGKVESVRVIRDSTTRVGKGIAYVQFEDENAVEAALLLNEKKFPPMLPRKLRVSRAKAQKKNAKPGSGRPTTSKAGVNSGYRRKFTNEEASSMGRTGKLLGRAAAAQVQKSQKVPPERPAPAQQSIGDGIKKPESFIFEGHRASSKQGKSGLKLGGKHAKTKGKARITKRSSSFKKKAA